VELFLSVYCFFFIERPVYCVWEDSEKCVRGCAHTLTISISICDLEMSQMSFSFLVPVLLFDTETGSNVACLVPGYIAFKLSKSVCSHD